MSLLVVGYEFLDYNVFAGVGVRFELLSRVSVEIGNTLGYRGTNVYARFNIVGKARW